MKKFICLFLSLFLFLSSVSAIEYTASTLTIVRIGDEIFPNHILMGFSYNYSDLVLLLWSNAYHKPYQVVYDNIIKHEYTTDESTGEEDEDITYEKVEFKNPLYSKGVAILGFELDDIDPLRKILYLYYSVE